MTNDSRFLRITIIVAVLALVVGIVFVNIQSKRALQQVASRDVFQRVQLAKEQIAQGSWDDAIRLLEETKASTETDNLNEEARKLLSSIDNLVIHAESSKAKRLAETELREASLRADNLLQSAGAALRNANLTDAERKLRQYLASPGANRKERARSLLDAIIVAGSDESALAFLVLLPEDEFSAFVSQGSLASFNLTGFDALRVRCVERLKNNLQEARTKRQMIRKRKEELARAGELSRARERAFRSWIDQRLYSDPDTKRLYDSWFAGFMEMCDRESVTLEHRLEYENVKRLMDTVGFGVFLKRYEEILTRYYNPNNYEDLAFEGEVRAAIEAARGEVVKDVLSTIAGSLPPR